MVIEHRNHTPTISFSLIVIALTHLFVARFIQHFMYSKGLCTSIEPFKRFIPIGKRTFNHVYINPIVINHLLKEWFKVKLIRH